MVVAGGLPGMPETLVVAERLVGAVVEVTAGDRDVRAAALAVALLGPDALNRVLEEDAAVRGLSYDFAERLTKLRRRARAGL